MNISTDKLFQIIGELYVKLTLRERPQGIEEPEAQVPTCKGDGRCKNLQVSPKDINKDQGTED